MTTETIEIRSAITRWTEALSRKDARAVVASGSEDIVVFSLAPPLKTPRSGTDGLDAWFATWRGPIVYALYDLAIEASGDLAAATAYAHLTGTKLDGLNVDLWFRITLVLQRTRGEWTIVHQHESVPYYMDGSGRACLDLKP